MKTTIHLNVLMSTNANQSNRHTQHKKTFYQRKNCYYGVDGVGAIEDISFRIIDVINKL